MNFSKRVIILNRLKSPEIAQAIFILKDKSVDEFSAVNEAERIVDEYLFLAENKPYGKKRKLFLVIGFVLCTLLGVFLALR